MSEAQQFVDEMLAHCDSKARISSADEAAEWEAIAARIRNATPDAQAPDQQGEVARIQAIADDETARADELEGHLEEETARAKVFEEALAFCAASKTTTLGEQPANAARAMWERAKAALAGTKPTTAAPEKQEPAA